MSASAIYEGFVAHSRRAPAPHSFRYRVFMPLATLSRIYANALRLRLKGAAYHPHPRIAAD